MLWIQSFFREDTDGVHFDTESRAKGKTDLKMINNRMMDKSNGEYQKKQVL